VEILRTGGYYSNLIYDREEKIKQFEKKKKSLLKRIDQQSLNDVEILKSKLDSLNDRKTTLLDFFVEGKFDKNELEKRRIKLDSDIDKITQELNELSKTNTQIFSDIEEIDDSVKKLKELKIGTTYSKQFIINQFKRMLVFKSPENERVMLIQTPIFDMVCNLDLA
ncbi:MAG: hypothetical protein JWN30_622, partial [Bacilli bacterium]|nr:hypothetical protein [Bacilli bacterium]